MPGNWYRLNRVLEIVSVAGRPLAELDLDTAAPLDYDFRCFFLNRRRSDLYRRIDARCEQMLAGGLLQVRACAQQQRTTLHISYSTLMTASISHQNERPQQSPFGPEVFAVQPSAAQGSAFTKLAWV